MDIHRKKKILVIGLSGESVFLNVDHLNKDGETVNSLSRFVEPGGKGYNQAITIGKLGGDVSFITTFGNSEYQKCELEILDKHNVKTYTIDKNELGSYAVIIVDKNGNNNVIVDKGASEKVTFEDIMKYHEVIDQADILLLQLEYPVLTMKKVIDYAYNQGKMIILNPAPKCELNEDTLKKVNILTPNEFEYSYLNRISLDDTHIVKTLGSRGSEYIYRNVHEKYEAKKVNAIDTTGAGDVFNGALTFYISNGYSIEESIIFATKTSAYKVQRKGIINGIPSLSDIKNIE